MSPHLARVAKEIYGYKNVKYMVAGHKAWQEGLNAYYTEPEFIKLAKENGISIILIDLRNSDSARKEHIEGALNFPVSDDPLQSMQSLNEILPAKHKKDARIIYYSDKPEEAIYAHKIMRSNGWQNGSILNGGIAAWKLKKYTLKTGPLETSISYRHSSLPGAMSLAEFETALGKRNEETIIIDVRSPEEYLAGTVPDAITIPIDTLDKRWVEIPKNKNVIIYCAAGNRALMGYRILKDKGWMSVHWFDGKLSNLKDTLEL